MEKKDFYLGMSFDFKWRVFSWEDCQGRPTPEGTGWIAISYAMTKEEALYQVGLWNREW